MCSLRFRSSKSWMSFRSTFWSHSGPTVAQPLCQFTLNVMRFQMQKGKLQMCSEPSSKSYLAIRSLCVRCFARIHVSRQAQALPIILGGQDLIGIARTGSGKTLAFLIPAIVHIEAQACNPLHPNSASPICLILAPTRELVAQTAEEASKLLENSTQGNHRHGISADCVYGGKSRQEQLRRCRGCAIVVATPGRLTDFVGSRDISLRRVTFPVLDEADRTFSSLSNCAWANGKTEQPQRDLTSNKRWLSTTKMIGESEKERNRRLSTHTAG